jgi:outer membrane receptor for ferrienterochelin and colicins
MRVSTTLLLMAAALLPWSQGYSQQAPSPASPDAALLDDLPVVEAASLHAQTLQEAPANVTIITQDEIRRYGYRTLGEALASVRGFYLTNDRTYQYVGVRGFSLPGDYNTRFLVMINGHSMTENVYGSNNYFGEDFGLDMDLVKRIEVIRGPSSALYGSNGMFATINIVTRSPVEGETARASIETDTFGERKAILTSSLNLGHGANLLISGSIFNNTGQDLFFPEYDSPGTNNGWARGVDGERGYHTFANLVWRNWSFTGYFSSREKNYPTPSFGTIFGDRGNKVLDTRDFVEAAWSRDVGRTGQLNWRLYYDQHEYWGRYDLPDDSSGGVQDNRDLSLGNWVGTKFTWRFDLPRRFGTLTVGTELDADLRTLQRNFDVQPAPFQYLDVNDLDRNYAAFLQHEWQFRKAWTASIGLRLDDDANHGLFLSPHLALVYQHSPKTVYKLMAGIAFRNPSAYEAYYDDQGVSQVANPQLRPEQIHTLEAAMERKLSKRVNAVATVYYYRLKDLIEAVTVGDGLVQYQNVSRYRAAGTEFELNGRWWRDVESAASLGIEDMDNLTRNGSTPPNSPHLVCKFRISAPLDRNRFTVSGAVQYTSSRKTFGDSSVAPVYPSDLTVTTNRLHSSFDLQFGIRNIFNQLAWDPASPGQGIDRIACDGRSAFVKVVWHTRQ